MHKRSNAKIVNIISQKYFQIYPTVHAHLKTDNVDYLKNPPWIFFCVCIFAIHSSSKHEKCCQMSLWLFSLFQGSRNQQCFNLMIVKGKCSFFISSHNLAHFYDDIFFSGLKLLKFSNQHLGNAVIVLLFFIDTSLLTENMLNWD